MLQKAQACAQSDVIPKVFTAKDFKEEPEDASKANLFFLNYFREKNNNNPTLTKQMKSDP